MDMELARTIRAEYEAGGTLVGLADKHKRRPETIGRLIREAGGKTRRKGRPRRVLTKADEDSICELYAAGGVAYKLARQFHQTTDAIKQIVQSRGIPLHDGPSWLAEGKRLYEAGATVVEIAAAVGVTHQRVSELARARGWRRPG